jgi:3-dehydroquinate synthetase
MRVLLKKNWCDIRLTNISVNDFVYALAKDKKAVGPELRVILTKGPGQMFKTPLSMTSAVTDWLAEYFASFDRPTEQNSSAGLIRSQVA